MGSSVLSFVLGIFAVVQVQAQATEPSGQPYLMAALGDSISAGFLADTTLTWFNNTGALNPESPLVLLASTLDLSKYKTPWDATETLESRYELSWSTGTWIISHYNLLSQYLQKTEPSASLQSINLAKTGGLTSDVVNQATQLVQMMNTGQYKSLKYVTLLIGDNDACKGTADQTMGQNMMETFNILSQIKQDEPIRILVSGLPRIPDLGQSNILTAKSLFDLSCSTVRLDLIQECVSLTSSETSTQYDQRVSVMEDKNQLLAKAVAQASTLYPNLQIIFSDALFSAPLVVSDLAIDCFHPNAGAQQTISQTLWNAQPWFH